LAADYPMVAPNYAAQRLELAKKLGLGRKPAAPAPKVKAKAPAKAKGAKKVALHSIHRHHVLLPDRPLR
jgi:predicted transcriptional regulator